MTLLVFTGTGDKLMCRPPNYIDTKGKKIGLIYFSEVKPKIVLSGDFVYESPHNFGTTKILGINDLNGPPFYVQLKENVTEFELVLLKPDMTPYTAKKNLLAILEIDD